MSAKELITMVDSGLLLMGIILGWLYLRADYEVDRFRQEMFKLRDEMFDYALGGGISFDHPAYRQLRQLANGLIRYAHRLTVWRTLIMFAWHTAFGVNRTPSFETELRKEIASISSAATRARMNEFHESMVSLMIWQLVRSSLFSILLRTSAGFGFASKEIHSEISQDDGGTPETKSHPANSRRRHYWLQEQKERIEEAFTCV